MSDEMRDPHRAVDYIVSNAGAHAAAKADRVFLEEFRKSKKAILMNASPEKSAVAREQYAYSHDEYIAVLHGIKAAVEKEETLKWHLNAAQARVEIWRTQCANERTQDRTMR